MSAETPPAAGRPAWLRLAAGIAAVAAVVYGMVAVDVVLRARSSYLEGEKYMRWNDHPEEKKAWLEQRFEKEKTDLEDAKSRGAVGPEEFQHKLALAEFERDEGMRESSVKYAFIWFQTAVELFTPPESRWVRLSRERLPEARRLWRAELESKGLKVEDYMLE